MNITIQCYIVPVYRQNMFYHMKAKCIINCLNEYVTVIYRTPAGDWHPLKGKFSFKMGERNIL